MFAEQSVRELVSVTRSGSIGAAALATPPPAALVARRRKSYAPTLVMPVTVDELALVPPGALSGIGIQSETWKR